MKRGRGLDKVYGYLFTCFTSRTAHIEDVSSLETDAFIQALRRFILNRRCSKEIWSDNGTNFAGADKEIGNCIRQWDQEDLNKKLIKDEMLAVSNAQVEIPTSRRTPHGWGLGKVHPKCT